MASPPQKKGPPQSYRRVMREQRIRLTKQVSREGGWKGWVVLKATLEIRERKRENIRRLCSANRLCVKIAYRFLYLFPPLIARARLTLMY